MEIAEVVVEEEVEEALLIADDEGSL
jgi:hypothetical protein